MSCFSVNGTGSFTLKLDESFVPVKTIFGFTLLSNDHLSFLSRDLTIEQPFQSIHNFCYKPVRICISFMENFSEIFYF